MSQKYKTVVVALVVWGIGNLPLVAMIIAIGDSCCGGTGGSPSTFRNALDTLLAPAACSGSFRHSAGRTWQW